MPAIKRRIFIFSPLALMFAATRQSHAAVAVFYRNPGCQCCHAWAEQMKAAGFALDLQDSDDLPAEQAKLGIPEALQGCHAGAIDGYSFSGHVPPADIVAFLASKPTARGLAVPGMPMGSPGMENGNDREPFDVMLFNADGTTRKFAHHG